MFGFRIVYDEITDGLYQRREAFVPADEATEDAAHAHKRLAWALNRLGRRLGEVYEAEAIDAEVFVADRLEAV